MTVETSSLETSHQSSPLTEAAHDSVPEVEIPDLRSSTDDHTVGATVTDGSVQERMEVGSEEVHGNSSEDKSFFQSSGGNPLSTTEYNDEDLSANQNDENRDVEGVLDPLQTQPEAQELSAVAEEDGTPFSAVETLYPTLEKKLSPVASKRASHLHLNLKPPSPQPWDLVEPPDADETKGNHDYYSTVDSRKFKTLQSTTPPVGQIGLHHPREVIRIERDYTGGELVQFAPIYPLELEGRITPTHFLESINAINELLISAHSLRHSFLDNTLAVLTLQLSRFLISSHYDKASTVGQSHNEDPDLSNQEMRQLESLVDSLNVEMYNPVGLNILWPRNVAFLYLEIEYYVSLPFPFAVSSCNN
ncbi:hypothetical protein DXG01_005746 [Tephrocybe rancida]|nr:hypothetical protein DXG01_005746 [Tephrocybe rancida]